VSISGWLVYVTGSCFPNSRNVSCWSLGRSWKEEIQEKRKKRKPVDA
jgi:hypothetical protein